MQAPPRPKRSPLLFVALGCVVLLALTCLGGFGLVVARLGDRPQSVGLPAGSVDPTPVAGGETPDPAGTGEAPESGDAPDNAPKPSSYPVRTEDDLERVCDRWYYPQSPAYAKKGPRPVLISAKQRLDDDIRTTKSFYGVPEGGSAKAERAWYPKNPATVQLVACLDLVKVGKRIRTCRFDDPKPAKVPMVEGVYRFVVYEVATHRKVTEATMTGEDEQCPTLVLLGADNRVFSDVNDRQLVEALRRYVEK